MTTMRQVFEGIAVDFDDERMDDRERKIVKLLATVGDAGLTAQEIARRTKMDVRFVGHRLDGLMDAERVERVVGSQRVAYRLTGWGRH